MESFSFIKGNGDERMEVDQLDLNEFKHSISEGVRSTIFNGVEEGIMITDRDSRIIRVNTAFEFVTGYSEKEVLHQRPSILNSGIHDRAFYEKMWKTVFDKGQWSGEIWNRRKTGDIYPEWLTITAIKDDRGSITNYCGIFEDLSEQKMTEKELERRKLTDILTGVSNRYAFLERMEALLQSSTHHKYHHALLFFDLDRFKQVNETLGHEVGDRLLIEVTERLQGILKNKDILARYGGDEFIVTATNVHNVQEVARIAEKITTLLSEPFYIEGQQVYISTSIGVSLYPEDGQTANTLIKKADQAMYYAKQNGRNQFAFYFDDLQVDSKRVLLLDNELRHAIRQKDFELYFQPKVDIKKNEISSVEALVRWNNDKLGFVSPAEFIPYAEETGLIIPISEIVIEKACEAHQLLKQRGEENINIAINISSIHFHRQNFIESIKHTFELYNCSPNFFELELTERTVMTNERDTIQKLIELKMMGFKLSIDDFGTGYSSLSYLVQFPLNYLKIDRSFIQSITSIADNEAVVDAIIQMAHRLHMKVIAEGVEQKEQVKLLQQMGCDMIQGYYYSKPLPILALVDFIEFWKLEIKGE